MKKLRSRRRYVLWLSLILGVGSWLVLPERLQVAHVPTASAAATFTVSSAGDEGCPPLIRNCTLRQVIIAANNNPGPDVINFRITEGSGLVKTITPLSELPAITDPVIIDGTSQPGYTGQPLIELSGVSAGPSASGLSITAGGSTVKGLVINRFDEDGISLSINGGNTIQSNYLGTDATGTTDLGNFIGVRVVCDNNMIGGPSLTARNIISGNNLAGIVTAGSGNQIQRNYIGTNAAGNAALGNLNGISMQGGGIETVGGPSLGIGNVISGNVGTGISTGAGSSARVQGNFIGTDPTGHSSIPNGGGGIRLGSGGCFVGGTTTGERNVISGNGSFGISVDSSNNQVHGNFIGISANGNPLGNNSSGVLINSTNNNVQNNTIAFNGSDGITVSAGTGNLLLSNRTFSNSGLGIDLGPDGVTPNDTGDGDDGANHLQNFPVLSSAVMVGNGVTVRGTLNSTPNTQFGIQLFSTDECAAGRGQGTSPYGSVNGVSTDAGGNVSFTFQGQAFLPGRFLIATAVKLVAGVGNETSEFSPCRQLVAPGTLQFSAVNYSVNENGGSASIIISRVGGSDGVASVLLSSFNGTATVGQDFTNVSGPISFVNGETSKTVLVPITDDNLVEGSETINFSLLPVTGGAAIGNPNAAVITIQDNDAAPTPTPSPTPVIRLGSTNYSGSEDCTTVIVTTQRIGDTSGVSTINYTTTSGTASDRADFTAATGTLRFGPGDTEKSFVILVNEDSLAEGTESASITLSNPSGATLSSPSIATLSILDDTSEPATNANDDSVKFVCQHYHDFLNRQADTAGQQFWVNEIESCGTDAQCRAIKRVNVSAAFFLSIEFQQTGYLVYRMYKVAYGNLPAAPVPLTLEEFLPDTQAIGQGVQVGIGDWQTLLENNKNAFAAGFVARSRFTTAFPSGVSAAQLVDTLNTNSGGALSPGERDQLVSELTSGARTRAQVLRAVAEDSTFAQAEFNRAFVLMQYFGYLRRNPNSLPDSDFAGYNFWLQKLNDFNGNFADAEMVRSFLVAGEYRHRFGQ